jgi:hypothetical protein
MQSAVMRDLASGNPGGDAGCGDYLFALDGGDDALVKVEKLSEQVFLGAEAVGREHSGVERGVSVFEGILASQFEGAIDGAESTLHFRKRNFPNAADFTASLGDSGEHAEKVLNSVLGRLCVARVLFAVIDAQSSGTSQVGLASPVRRQAKTVGAQTARPEPEEGL